MFVEHEPNKCYLEPAVDGIPHMLKGGQMVNVICTYALQIIFPLLKLRVFWPHSHNIVIQLHNVGILAIHG